MRFLSLIFLLFFFLVNQGSLAQGSEASVLDKAEISKSITIYPNPATDFVNIKLGELDASQAKLILYNILGNEVQIETEVVDQHELRVRVKELSSGYYLIAVRDEQTQFRGTYKFLKR